MSAEMSLSPLQMKQLIFDLVHVEAVDEPVDTEELWAPNFDFNGVVVAVNIVVAAQEDQQDDPANYVVKVRLTITNDDTSTKKAPYEIDVVAQALFELQPVFDVEKRESIVRINGGSLVVGAIRETVTQLTARSLYGPMTLPTPPWG